MDYPLDVKLGQMLMVGFRGATPQECSPFLDRLRRYHVGGVWLTDAASPMGRVPGNIRSPEQVKTLTAALQAAATFPLIISIDAEGGQVIRLKEEFGFPRFSSAQALGERDDPGYTREEASRLAGLLKQLGINLNLAPVVDVNRNPRNPVIGARERSFSADPQVVARHASAFIEAHHEQGVLCALKHYPGHGSSSTDSHLGMVDVTQTWSPEELTPYRELIANGLSDAVLSAHVFIRHIDPDRPATLSSRIMTDLLRTDLGFHGVVFSDDMNMRAIGGYYPPDEALELALNAGIDVIVHGNCAEYDEQIVEHALERLLRLVHAGRISERRIDASFARIQAMKRRLSGVQSTQPHTLSG